MYERGIRRFLKGFPDEAFGTLRKALFFEHPGLFVG